MHSIFAHKNEQMKKLLAIVMDPRYKIKGYLNPNLKQGFFSKNKHSQVQDADNLNQGEDDPVRKRSKEPEKSVLIGSLILKNNLSQLPHQIQHTQPIDWEGWNLEKIS